MSSPLLSQEVIACIACSGHNRPSRWLTFNVIPFRSCWDKTQKYSSSGHNNEGKTISKEPLKSCVVIKWQWIEFHYPSNCYVFCLLQGLGLNSLHLMTGFPVFLSIHGPLLNKYLLRAYGRLIFYNWGQPLRESL